MRTRRARALIASCTLILVLLITGYFIFGWAGVLILALTLVSAALIAVGTWAVAEWIDRGE